jgi:anti-sigma B factor antagonist
MSYERDVDRRRMVDRGPFSISVHDSGPVWVLELFGELDLDGAPELERELRLAESREPQTLLVDLSGLDFIDSSGIAVLVHATERSRQNGNSLTLLRGSPAVDRIVELTGLGDHLPIVD